MLSRIMGRGLPIFLSVIFANLFPPSFVKVSEILGLPLLLSKTTCAFCKSAPVKSVGVKVVDGVASFSLSW